MELVDRTVSDFCEVLASEVPAPGGGSAAALDGAAGCALIGKVAKLTLGRKKYAAHEQFMEECVEQAEEFRQRFVGIIDRDAGVFNSVLKVIAMPKGTDEEKAMRADAMQGALCTCTFPPIDAMGNALLALEMAWEMQGRFNVNAASDLGVAALSLKAAVQGAWLNVLTNLVGIKDEVFVKKFREGGEGILKKAIQLADSIHDSIHDSILDSLQP